MTPVGHRAVGLPLTSVSDSPVALHRSPAVDGKHVTVDPPRLAFQQRGELPIPPILFGVSGVSFVQRFGREHNGHQELSRIGGLAIQGAQ